MEITQRVWDALHPAVQKRVEEALEEVPVGQPAAATCVLLTSVTGEGHFSAAFLQLCSQQHRLFELARPFEQVLEVHRGCRLGELDEATSDAVRMSLGFLGEAFAQPPELVAMQYEIAL